MAAKPLNVIAELNSINRAPSTMYCRWMLGDYAASPRLCDHYGHGFTQTGNQAQATWLEVLNVTGKGVIQALALGADDAQSVSPCGIKLTIDGNVAVEETGLSVYHYAYNWIVGGFCGGGSTNYDDVLMFLESVQFHTSFVVEIQGDGSDWATCVYNYYLT